jgi:primosomal protein N' (replication factor Y) (superfamily II helicase)
VSATPARATCQVVPLVDVRALDRPLDYLVPPDLDDQIVVGAVVAAPLGKRRVAGVVVGREPSRHEGRLVSLVGRVDTPPVDAELLDLARWVSRYYAAPLVASLRLVLPPGAEGALRRGADGVWHLGTPSRGVREQRVARLTGAAGRATGRRAEVVATLAASGGVLVAADLARRAHTTTETLRRMAADGLITIQVEEIAAAEESVPGWANAAQQAPTLTADQRVAVAEISERLAGSGGALLIFGVTGSGKTEVYLTALEEARTKGRGAILLVPEISLTPQTVARLRARLGTGVAVWHSGLTPAQRAREYARVRDGRADVVVGARSAVFAPVRDLGLVIVDEEHDASYKQDNLPRYDARQVAFRRATTAGATLVYASATPRPETWRALPRVSMPTRADGSPLPRIELVDMRTQPPGPVSRPLAAALRDAAERGERALLLLNRRGEALMQLCRSCGWIGICPDCDVPMVLHRGPLRLACHHCGREDPPPTVCPRCRAAGLVRSGTGTQGLERALAEVVPDVRLVRMDASSAQEAGGVAALLARFAEPGAAILLGTQMVAKGHDLPGVTVAAVLDADAGLRQPDFRSEERAFALAIQAAGRAGRRGEATRVIVQAWEPAGRAMQLAARGAVAEFLDGELERREEMQRPPFGHLVRLVIEGLDPEAVRTFSQQIGDGLRRGDPEITISGPARLHRVRGRTRRSLLIRAERAAVAVAAILPVLDAFSDGLQRAELRVGIDVDPQQT